MDLHVLSFVWHLTPSRSDETLRLTRHRPTQVPLPMRNSRLHHHQKADGQIEKTTETENPRRRGHRQIDRTRGDARQS